MNGHINTVQYPIEPRIRRVTMPMADGRELIYFDDIGSTLPAERAFDPRELEPRPASAQLRQDPLSGEWISMATARQNRVFLPPAQLDPLAPQTPENPSEIPSSYNVVVFENKSPSFGPELADAPDAPPSLQAMRQIGLERRYRSIGRCEVVCFSPDHSGSLGSQSANRTRTVIEAWAERTARLSALPGIQQVFPFENRGEAIGVTLPHPHGQIYAYPYITPRTEQVLASIKEYGPSLFEDILQRELAGERLVFESEHWAAFVPFAARWPIEIHLMPKRHIPDLAETTLAERDELAEQLPRLLSSLDRLYDSPTPYIAAWHQAPVNEARDELRLSLQIVSPRRAADKLKYLAGSEAAMGAWVADISPEVAAANLRTAWQAGQL